MTLSEFKAWLEGYSESFENGHPDLAQWKKISEKLNGVDASATGPQVHQGILGQPNIGRFQLGSDLYANRYDTLRNYIPCNGSTAVRDAVSGAKLGSAD